MTLIVTGDLHLSSNPRDRYRHRWFEDFIRLVEQRRPQAVVILGDLTEEKDLHTASLVNDVVSYIAALASLTDVLGVQGNHDYVADPSNGFWHFLSHIEHVRWIAEPRTLLSTYGYERLLFLPHTRDYKRDWAPVKSYFDADWIFCHNSFDGARTGGGHKLTGIPLDVFPDDARVISGDVHVPQTLGPLTYVGAPYLCDFGDDYEPRVLELSGLSKKSILTKGPQKRLIEVNTLAELDRVTNIARGDIVKVRMNLPVKERDVWRDYRREIEDWAAHHKVTLEAAQPKFQMGNKRIRATNFAKRSDEEILKAFAKAKGLGQATLDVGLELTTEG